jgi:hypothetical protein
MFLRGLDVSGSLCTSSGSPIVFVLKHIIKKRVQSWNLAMRNSQYWGDPFAA